MSEQWRRLVAKIWNYKPHMLFPPPDHEKISFWCDDIHLIVYKNASAKVNMKIQQSELDSWSRFLFKFPCYCVKCYLHFFLLGCSFFWAPIRTRLSSIADLLKKGMPTIRDSSFLTLFFLHHLIVCLLHCDGVKLFCRLHPQQASSHEKQLVGTVAPLRPTWGEEGKWDELKHIILLYIIIY